MSSAIDVGDKYGWITSNGMFDDLAERAAAKLKNQLGEESFAIWLLEQRNEVQGCGNVILHTIKWPREQRRVFTSACEQVLADLKSETPHVAADQIPWHTVRVDKLELLIRLMRAAESGSGYDELVGDELRLLQATLGRGLHPEELAALRLLDDQRFAIESLRYRCERVDPSLRDEIIFDSLQRWTKLPVPPEDNSLSSRKPI